MRNQAHFAALFKSWGRTNADYAQKKMRDILKANPAADVWNTATDMTDLPRFQYREEALGGRIAGTIPDFVVLIAAGLLLFVAAYVSFVRYDAR
jgi:ABC-type sugar transport system substrate-binding protein